MTKSNGGSRASNALRDMVEKHPERVHQLAEAIQALIRDMEELEKLSNDELADLLLDEVWGDLNIFSRESSIVEVAIERLKGKKPK